MKSLYSYFSFLIIYFFAVSSIFSPIRALPFFNYLWLFLIFLWFLITLLEMPGFFGNQTIYMYSICIFIFYTVFISFFTKNISLGSRYLEFSQILIFYFEYKKNVIAKRAGQNRRVIYSRQHFENGLYLSVEASY